MTVADLMSRPAITCHVNDTCQVAALRMRQYEYGAIAVVNDDGQLVGIVTDRDICMAAASHARVLDDLLVNAAMTANVVSARSTDHVAEAEELMASHRVRRLPVIDDAGRPIGLLALDDIARKGRGVVEVGHTLAAICARPANT